MHCIIFDLIFIADNAKNGPSLKSVNANRAVFEQGFQTQELENDILRNTQLERQRELDMLRSRFNRNKEMAQAAAGSCIRTSESSEVKSNSPKSSPVCPVKPTPALVKQCSMVYPSCATTFGMTFLFRLVEYIFLSPIIFYLRRSKYHRLLRCPSLRTMSKNEECRQKLRRQKDKVNE